MTKYDLNDLKTELRQNLGYKRKLAIIAYRSKYYFKNVKKNKLALVLSKILSRVCSYICMYEIPIESVRIGRNLLIPHGFSGCFFAPNTEIGENAILYHNVTIGIISENKKDAKISIGNNVVIGCNSTILGNILIGDNEKISAGTVLFNPQLPKNG